MFELFTQITLVVLSSFVSIYLVYDFMFRVFGKKFNYMVIYVIMFLAMWILFTISNLFSFPFLSIALTIFLPLLTGILLFDVQNKNDIFIIILFIIFLPLCEIISQMVKMLFFSTNFTIAPGHIIEDLIIFMIYRIIMFLLEKRIKPFSRSKHAATIVLVPVISLYIIATLTLLIANIDNKIMIFLAVWSCILIFSMNIFVCNLFDRISGLSDKEKQYLMKEQQAHMQYKYYNELEKKYENSNRLFHDMKRHVNLLEQLYQNEKEDGQARKYANSLLKEVEAVSFKFHTNNQIFNILVNDKILLAELNGIKFQYSCENIDWKFIEDIDLATLLSNLLDNAFDACMEENESEKKIELCVCTINNFVVLNITNTCSNQINIKEGKYISSKKEHMGIGLSNVKSIVEKYDGSIKIHQKEGLFTVHVTFSGIL